MRRFFDWMDSYPPAIDILCILGYLVLMAIAAVFFQKFGRKQKHLD